MSSPETIYRACLDPDAIAAWRPPTGMKCEILAFDPSEGGEFRMAFTYVNANHPAIGKTSEHADVFHGRFATLVPNERIVEVVEFETDDPVFAGTMTVITTLAAVPGGTNVTVVCKDVPDGISAADHQAGMASSLENLARFTESR